MGLHLSASCFLPYAVTKPRGMRVAIPVLGIEENCALFQRSFQKVDLEMGASHILKGVVGRVFFTLMSSSLRLPESPVSFALWGKAWGVRLER